MTIIVEHATCYSCKIVGTHISYNFKQCGDICLCPSCSKTWNEYSEPKYKQYIKNLLKGRAFSQLTHEEYTKYQKDWQEIIENLFEDFLKNLLPEKVQFT